MDTLITILAVVFNLGVIIFIHELGHLLVAKAFGVKVLAFSLGFGKRLFGFQRGETEYFVSALPLGGYVRLGGESVEEQTDDPRDFVNKPRWQRVLVYLAGPVMNIILAIGLIAALLMNGAPVGMNLANIEPVVGHVEEGGPAAMAGLVPGDRIVAIGDDKVDSWQDVILGLTLQPGNATAITFRRGEEERNASVTPRKDEEFGYGDAGLWPVVLPRITNVSSGSAAASAGLEAGDELFSLDGHPVVGTQQFVDYVSARPNQEIQLVVRRQGQELQVPVTPQDLDGTGRIGIGLGWIQKLSLGPAIVESARFNWTLTRDTLKILGKILTGKVAAKNAVSGPLDIAKMSGDAARQGPGSLFQLMAIISISIAIFNLLPIPLLDGGQIFILLIEMIRRRDLPISLKEKIQTVGFFLVIGLMAAVILLDVSKRLPSNWFGG